MSNKKVTKQQQCLKCGCEEFVSEPNQYDVLRFEVGKFEVRHAEDVHDKIKIFCRACGAEIDEQMSEKKGRIVLQTANKNI